MHPKTESYTLNAPPQTRAGRDLLSTEAYTLNAALQTRVGRDLLSTEVLPWAHAHERALFL